MQIYFRLNKTTREKIKKVDNVVFEAKVAKRVSLVPIPQFLKDAKCHCGKPADFMRGDMTCICSKCFTELFKDVTKRVTKPDVSIPIIKATILHMTFEWSVNKERWYSVYGKNLKPRNWQSFVAKIRELVATDTILSFEADYRKDPKELIIY